MADGALMLTPEIARETLGRVGIKFSTVGLPLVGKSSLLSRVPRDRPAASAGPT